MHVVIETPAYIRAAHIAGLSERTMNAIVDLLAIDPDAGDLMKGCGGARKLRVAREGSGKSGGYRVITFYGGDDIPVFLLTVFPKNVKANLSPAERTALAGLTKRLRESLRGA